MEWQMLLDYAPQGASSRPALRALPETARDSSRERGYPDVLSALLICASRSRNGLWEVDRIGRAARIRYSTRLQIDGTANAEMWSGVQ